VRAYLSGGSFCTSKGNAANGGNEKKNGAAKELKVNYLTA